MKVECIKINNTGLIKQCFNKYRINSLIILKNGIINQK